MLCGSKRYILAMYFLYCVIHAEFMAYALYILIFYMEHQTSVHSVHLFDAVFTMYAFCVFSLVFSSLQWRIP